MARFYAFHRVPHEFLDPDDLLSTPLERDLEDLVLGQVEQIPYVFPAVVGCLHDLRPHVDEPT